MTLQWTFVATVLYIELALVGILMLPFVSPKSWQKVFRSRLAGVLSTYSRIYFYIFIAILVMLFAESVREAKKYSEPLESEDLRRYPEAEALHQMKLFRAQRNMYIAGFALYLWFVLRRLVVLIASEATLMAESEASIRQAQSATATAQQLLEQQSLVDDNKKNSAAESKSEKESSTDPSATEKELARTQEELEKTKEELYRAKVQFETMKKQAESTNTEYDRLLKEHEKLQNELDSREGSGDKKDN